LAKDQRKTVEYTHHKRQLSTGRRTESKDFMMVLSSRFDAGGDVSANELLVLSFSAVREISKIDSQDLLGIFRFLLMFRVMGMTDIEISSFRQNLEKIASWLSPKISHNGEMVTNPFRDGRNSTGRELRLTIYREALRVGQVEAANVFA